MRKAYELILKAEMTVAKIALFVLSALVFAAAVARNLRYPIAWANDAATFLFAWCVFLGGDVAMRKDRLFCITVLTAKLPRKAQHYLNVANYVIIALFLVGMIVFGVSSSIGTWQRAFQGMPGVSYTWVTISVPIGCALMLTTTVSKIRKLILVATGRLSEEEIGPKTDGSSEII